MEKYPQVKTTDIIDYYKQNALTDCATKFGMTVSAIKYRLVNANITIRNRSETAKITGRLWTPRNCGQDNPSWKGGRKISSRGYVEIYVPQENGRGKYIQEHRLIWQEHFGEILKGYVIHHLNGVKTDNRIENLSCLKTKSHDRLIPLLQERIRELEHKLNGA